MKTVTAVAVVLGAVLAVACGDSTGPGASSQHLYVPDVGSGKLYVYNLPVNDASQPADTLTLAAPIGVAVNAAGRLAVMNSSGKVYLLDPPISSSSAPVDSFVAGTAGGLLRFDAAGALYVPTQSPRFLRGASPVSHTPVPDTISDSVTSAFGIAFGSANRLYVANNTSAHTILAFDSPYTAAPAFVISSGLGSVRGIAFSGGQLFAADVSGSRVGVYTVTLSGTSDIAFAISAGLASPEGLAVDAAGNLYVANLGAATVTIYAPPFSASSAATVTLTVTSGVLFGIAIGR